MTKKLSEYLDLSIELVVAHDKNYVIGRNGKLPWHLPEDLKRFKALTEGHAVVMGRNTYESLPENGLPHRQIYMVGTRKVKEDLERVVVVPSVLEAVRQAILHRYKKLFIVGGIGVYEEALKAGIVDVIHKTFVDTEVTETGGITAFDTFKAYLNPEAWLVESFEHFDGFSTTVLRSRW